MFPKVLSAIDQSPKLIVLAFVVLLSVRILALDLGVDHLTTVTWTTPMSLAIAGASGISMACVLFVYHRSTAARPQLDVQRPTWTTQPVLLLLGVSVVGFAVSWATGSLLGIVAQHLPGEMTTISATVEEVASFHSARATCRSEITVVPDNDGHGMTFCLLLHSGRGSGPSDLQSGEHVSIRLRQTTLGDVVESVSRTQASLPP